jgi:hypothetical protein
MKAEIDRKIRKINSLAKEHGYLVVLKRTMEKTAKEQEIPYNEEYYNNVSRRIEKIEQKLMLLPDMSLV